MKLKATKYLLPTTDGRLHKELSYLISLHENKMNKGKLESRISDLEHQFKQLEHNYREACLELADRDNESELVIELQKFLKIKDDYIQKHIANPIDKGISISNSQGTEIKHPNDGGIELFKQPIESTQELFKTDDTSTTNDDTITIEQLKEKDVLVFKGESNIFKKYQEYTVIKDNLLIDDKGIRYNIETIDLSQFTLKAKPSEETTKGRVYLNYESIDEKCYAIGISEKDQIVLFENDVKKAKIFNSFDEFKKEYEGMMSEFANPIFEPIFTSEDDNHKNPTFIVAPTPDPITSTTLKTPNEWLKLMSEEERTQWIEERQKSSWNFYMDKESNFKDFIMQAFLWSRTPQGMSYWQNISNRYNN